MAKNLKLILLVVAAGWMMGCEKNSEGIPGGSSEPCVQLVNKSGLDAECAIIGSGAVGYNGELFLPAKAFSESEKVNLYSGFGPFSELSVSVTVTVRDTMPLTERKIQENTKYTFRSNHAYQIVLDRQAKFFYIGLEN